MDNLVRFLARGLVTHPDDVHVNIVEGESVVMVELKVHDDDVRRLIGSQGRNVRAIRQILSAASGRKKAVLEVINLNDGKEEESAAEE